MIGVAPTARAARELEEQAGIHSRTLDRLLLETDHLGERIPTRSVVIFDEAGMAPTRLSARLLARAQDAGAKIIAIGDPLQLPSVQAGGWLRAVGTACGAVRLTKVMRHRDAQERTALAALRDREPQRYLEWANAAGRIEVFTSTTDAARHAIELWHQAVRAMRPGDVVMIARDNETRDDLNNAARELWGALGLLGEGRTYGALALAVGDRVICRRNDAGLDVDNGMRGTVRELNDHGAVIKTDAGATRELPEAYVDEHVEYAYALTAHSMQGATVERAIVLASPRDLTAGWSYTALSRARGETRVLIVDADKNERSEFAPSGSAVARDPCVTRIARRMLERDDEDLAIEQLAGGHGGDADLIRASLRDRHRQETAALRALQRIDDLDQRAVRLKAQHARVSQQLEVLPEPTRRGRDPHALERAQLEAARRECARELERALDRRTLPGSEMAEPTEPPSEPDGLEHATSVAKLEYDTLRKELIERHSADRLVHCGVAARSHIEPEIEG
ncbi:MAG TPA: AAA family ATPase [Solirubrobacteraceae bacterium]|nr:AAA family ATPase [Solirubrobacteraceae bacterium]